MSDRWRLWLNTNFDHYDCNFWLFFLSVLEIIKQKCFKKHLDLHLFKASPSDADIYFRYISLLTTTLITHERDEKGDSSINSWNTNMQNFDVFVHPVIVNSSFIKKTFSTLSVTLLSPSEACGTTESWQSLICVKRKSSIFIRHTPASKWEYFLFLPT